LSNHVDISAKLDGLTGNVDQLLRSFRLLNQNLAQGGSRDHDAEIVTNLESCVRSAGKLVSSATTLVNSRSQKGSQFGSEFGTELSDQERIRIEGWIPQPTIFEATDYRNLEHSLSTRPSTLPARSLISVAKKSHTRNPPAVPQDPPSVPQTPPSTAPQDPPAVHQVRTMTKQNTEISIQNHSGPIPTSVDIDYDLIESLLMSAKNKFANKDYEGAEKVLRRIMIRANVTYITAWKWRDEILRLLTVCYCQLEWWQEAAKVLDQDFKGKEKEMATLVTEFCLEDRFDAAKNVLSRDFAGRAKILEFYAKRANWEKRWVEAEEALLKLLDSLKAERSLPGFRRPDRSLDIDRFRYMQALAEVRYAKGTLDAARDVCLKAMYGRKNTLGRTHVLYYQSINLLALICEAQNDQVEAEGYKALLPSEFEGTTLADRLRITV
jgi:hypothetical protein